MDDNEKINIIFEKIKKLKDEKEIFYLTIKASNIIYNTINN